MGYSGCVVLRAREAEQAHGPRRTRMFSVLRRQRRRKWALGAFLGRPGEKPPSSGTVPRSSDPWHPFGTSSAHWGGQHGTRRDLSSAPLPPGGSSSAPPASRKGSQPARRWYAPEQRALLCCTLTAGQSALNKPSQEARTPGLQPSAVPPRTPCPRAVLRWEHALLQRTAAQVAAWRQLTKLV